MKTTSSGYRACVLAMARHLSIGFLGCVLGTLPPAFAWAGGGVFTGSGDWFDSARWSGGVPGSLDGADVVGAARITIPGAAAGSLLVDGSVDVISDSVIPGSPAGTLSVGSLISVGYSSAGTVTIGGGGKIFSGNVVVGDRSSGSVIMDGTSSTSTSGAQWTYSGRFRVGGGSFSSSGGFISTDGSLSMVHGAVLTGVASTSDPFTAVVQSGSATLDASTWASNGALGVGGGVATLFVGNGSTLSDGYALIGDAPTPTISAGTVQLDHSTWNNATDLSVGETSIGKIFVTNGSTVTNGAGYLGRQTGSSGQARIDGSTWANSATLDVGYYGAGTLEILNGATVTNTYGAVGVYNGSSGSVTVDHATWTNSGDLTIGYNNSIAGAATGVLLVRNGGIVNSQKAEIGWQTGSTGIVTVTGVNTDGTPSTWNVNGYYLRVGDSGQGTLNIDAGGIVRAPATYLGYSAVQSAALNLSGTAGARGVLETGQISQGSGGGPTALSTLTFNGGILRATGDQPDFLRHFSGTDIQIGAGGAFIDTNSYNVGIASPITGNGGLTKTGSGVLDLKSINGYVGLTTVDAGKLLVNGSIFGGAQVNSGATLGGSGVIAGPVTVAPGGILSPGNSPGTLTVGSLTLNHQATLIIDIGATSDLLLVNGDVILDGTINFLGDPTYFSPALFPKFLQYTGTLTDNGVKIGSVPPGLSASNFTLDFSTPGEIGIMASVPEPSSLALWAVGVMVLPGYVRWQQKRA